MQPRGNHASGAGHKPGKFPGSRWLRNIQAVGLRVRREGVSLRTELILLLGVLVLIATASLGSIAYGTARSIIERAAIREVGVTATVRKQVLLRVLNQQRVRAEALLKTASIGCAVDLVVPQAAGRFHGHRRRYRRSPGIPRARTGDHRQGRILARNRGPPEHQ